MNTPVSEKKDPKEFKDVDGTSPKNGTETESDYTRRCLRARLVSEIILGSRMENEVSRTFDGYGDSGDMSDGDPQEKGVDDFFNSMLDHVKFDWYNNEGGSVQMVWHLDTDIVFISGYANITTTEQMMDDEEH